MGSKTTILNLAKSILLIYLSFQTISIQVEALKMSQYVLSVYYDGLSKTSE